MSNSEMVRRLKGISQSFRLSIYRELKEGCSAYAACGWDRRGLKAANAVSAWMDKHPGVAPTDEAIA